MAQFTLSEVAGSSRVDDTLKDGKIYVTCPFEKSHSIQEDGLQFHLVKCVANYKDKLTTLKHCPFDKTHVISISEMVDHVANCPKRELFDSYKYNINAVEPSVSIPEPPQLDHVDEDWSDCNYNTYEIEKEIADKQIYRKKIGTKSEKREFREKQRNKHGQSS